MIAATRDDSPDATNYQMVVAMVQAEFCDGTLAEEGMWQTVILIPKWRRDFRGIGLVEVLCKAVAGLLNFRLTAASTYQDALHRLWASRGMGTAVLEAKLFQ